MKINKFDMYWLCFIIIPINLTGDFLSEKIGIQAVTLNTVTILVYFSLVLLKKKIAVSRAVVYFLIANIIISFIHMLEFYNLVNEFKHLTYIFLFFIVSSTATEEMFGLILKVLKTASGIMIIDALIHVREVQTLGYRVFNVRNYTIMDKTFYTMLFPILIIITFNEIVKEKRKWCKTFRTVYMILLVLILYGVFESKLGIATAVIGILAEGIIINEKYKKSILKLCVLIIISFIAYYIILKKSLPDYVQALIGFLNDDYSKVNAVYFQTYFIRLEILALVFRTFEIFPMLGCGFGNYYNFVSKNNWQVLSLGIQDVESSLFEMLAEGGIIYILINIVLIWMIFIKMIKYKQDLIDNQNRDIDYLGSFICLVILLVGNDFMNVFYWIIMGNICSFCIRKEHSYCKSTEKVAEF